METRAQEPGTTGARPSDLGSADLGGCNRTLIIGELATEPESRTLPGGAELFSFSLRVRRPGEQTTSVPLAWYDPPKRVHRWKLGTPIAATGAVVRRFFRAGGVTASRTEVTVHQADVLTQRSRTKKLLEKYTAEIAEVVAEHTVTE